MSGLVLVVGAAGKFAGHVVPALVARGATIRGLVHEAKAMIPVREEGAADAVVGDLREHRSIAAVLEGVESVFYVAPAFLQDEAQVGVDFVAAAVKAGVRRFVFSSVIHPVLSALSNHAAKAPVEEAILDSGLEYTLLHPALFFQNYARAWRGIARTGVLAEPGRATLASAGSITATSPRPQRSRSPKTGCSTAPSSYAPRAGSTVMTLPPWLARCSTAPCAQKGSTRTR